MLARARPLASKLMAETKVTVGVKRALSSAAAAEASNIASSVKGAVGFVTLDRPARLPAHSNSKHSPLAHQCFFCRALDTRAAPHRSAPQCIALSMEKKQRPMLYAGHDDMDMQTS